MLKALIVDDEGIERRGIAALINRLSLPYETKAASNGEDALELLRQERFDVLLTDIEMKLVRAFASRRGEVLSRDRLLNEVWGTDYFGTTRTLDQHVANLRRKVDAVGGDSAAIATMHGVGYSYK